MKAKLLAPIQLEPRKPAVSRPTCQHDVDVVGQWAQDYREEAHKKGVRRHRHTERPNQCTFQAVVEIDGVPLCRRHAGQIALAHLLEKG